MMTRIKNTQNLNTSDVIICNVNISELAERWSAHLFWCVLCYVAEDQRAVPYDLTRVMRTERCARWCGQNRQENHDRCVAEIHPVALLWLSFCFVFQRHWSELFFPASSCALVPAERGCDESRTVLYSSDARRRNAHLAREGKTGVGGSQPPVPFHCKSTMTHLDLLHAILFVL